MVFDFRSNIGCTEAAKRSLALGFAESSSSPLTRRTVYDRVHSLIQQLLSLVPTLPSILYPILARHFPHKRQAQFEHVTYIRNLLRLSDYCPELSDRLLGLVVDRTIQIDVRSPQRNFIVSVCSNCLFFRSRFKLSLRNWRQIQMQITRSSFQWTYSTQ